MCTEKVLMVVVGDISEREWEPQRRRFGTTTSDLHQLSAWLREQEVQQAVMESTAQYWKPVWYEFGTVYALGIGAGLFQPGSRGDAKHDFRDARALGTAAGGGGVDPELCAGVRATPLADHDADEGAAHPGTRRDCRANWSACWRKCVLSVQSD